MKTRLTTALVVGALGLTLGAGWSGAIAVGVLMGARLDWLGQMPSALIVLMVVMVWVLRVAFRVGSNVRLEAPFAR